ncbi:MAG TPA: hypothetical protein VIL86_13545 [Tepidisphaeraceae bacterium]
MPTATLRKSRAIGDRYLELVRKFPLRPISSEKEREQAVELYKELVFQDHPLIRDEIDYMEAMLVFMADYEKRHPVTFEKSPPLEILKFLMEERQLKVGDLGRIIGSQPNASLILSGKRGLSKANIRKLAEFFAVEAGLFL